MELDTEDRIWFCHNKKWQEYANSNLIKHGQLCVSEHKKFKDAKLSEQVQELSKLDTRLKKFNKDLIRKVMPMSIDQLYEYAIRQYDCTGIKITNTKHKTIILTLFTDNLTTITTKACQTMAKAFINLEERINA